MRIHPNLKDLLGLSSEYIDEQLIFKLEKCCPNCKNDLLVAPEALACVGNDCLWQAGANYDLVSIVDWVWEPTNQIIMIHVNYDINFTTIEINGIKHMFHKTMVHKNIEEIYELLLWM